jgi:DNA gyrase subunit A
LKDMTKNQERILDVDVSQEMRQSFLEYSYSVIYSRALPDVRDGLKPVQRRIIYQMGEMGLRPDRGHVKSARVTGEVMGKLHPHGDGAIYDALVRMAQSFSLRLTLIDGHGNFGSLDDGPAAARYTEVRLTHASIALNESLDEDTVDFAANYDAQLTEPEVLPAAFPNLLVNGASGIAVGMATNMPPHNLGEVIDALQLLLQKPKATLAQIMDLIPGPDLPSGGVILVGEGISDAYRTGKGSFRMRAKVSIESVAPRRTGLVITELPLSVGPERVIEKIRDGVNGKKLQGIHNVVDLTDRENGLKLVVELKSGVDPDSVIEALYRLTPLEESFGINNVALVKGRPQQLGLLDLLKLYLEHRLEVTTRRSRNRLEKRQARLHLIAGLQLAVVNLDEIIQVIRSSDTAEDARKRLIKVFDLSEVQSEYILELKLRRLTKLSILELETEAEQLTREIAELESILSDERILKKTISKELAEVRKEHANNRRTELIDASNMEVRRLPAQVKELADEPTVVTLSPTGIISRSFDEGIGQSITTSVRSDIGIVLSDGRAIQVHVSDVPESKDLTAAKFVGSEAKVLGIIPWSETGTLALGTAFGVVKRIAGPMPDKHEVSLIALREDDFLVGFCPAEDSETIGFVTSSANALTFAAEAVRPQGLPAAGMAGINSYDLAIYFGKVVDGGFLVTAANSSSALGKTDPGSIKITPIKNYPKQGRGSKGVRCHKFLKAEDQLYFAKFAGSSPTLFDESEKIVKAPAVEQKRDGTGKKATAYIAAAI